MSFRGEAIANSYIGFTDRPAFTDAREISRDVTAAYVDESSIASSWSTTATSRR